MIQLIFLLLGLLFTIAAFSGFASIIHFNDIMIWISLGLLIYYVLPKNDSKSRLTSTWMASLLLIGCGIELFNVMIHYDVSTQILNYITLFGLMIGVKLLARLRWDKMNWYWAGIILWIASWILIQMFLPEHILAGWNPNSSIGIVPIAICAMSLIYCSKKRWCIPIFFIAALLTLSPIIELKNRSAMVAIVFFGVIVIPPVWKIINSLLIFRLFYLGVLIFNVLLPFNYQSIGSSDTMESAMEISQDLIEKNEGYNDREDLWDFGTAMLSESPVLGNAGQRDLYLHNFSIDILTQFGWLGWSIFALMYCSLMEACYQATSRSNIFLFGFGCVLLLNSFENVLFACNTFSIFPYILFAIPWRLKMKYQKRSIFYS